MTKQISNTKISLRFLGKEYSAEIDDGDLFFAAKSQSFQICRFAFGYVSVQK